MFSSLWYVRQRQDRHDCERWPCAIESRRNPRNAAVWRRIEFMVLNSIGVSSIVSCVFWKIKLLCCTTLSSFSVEALLLLMLLFFIAKLTNRIPSKEFPPQWEIEQKQLRDCFSELLQQSVLRRYGNQYTRYIFAHIDHVRICLKTMYLRVLEHLSMAQKCPLCDMVGMFPADWKILNTAAFRAGVSCTIVTFIKVRREYIGTACKIYLNIFRLGHLVSDDFDSWLIFS